MPSSVSEVRAPTTFPQLCYKVLINDVEPRVKKYGFHPPAVFVGALVKLEHEKIIARKQLREYLDEFYREIVAIQKKTLST